MNALQPGAAVTVSVVVVSFNTCALLRRCLLSLAQQHHAIAVDIIVVDNASTDGSAAMVAEVFPHIRLIRSAVNLGFAAANNLAFASCRGPFVALLNPDAHLPPGTLDVAVARMRAMPEVGLAGGRLRDEHGRAQPSGRMFPSLLNELLVISGMAVRHPHSKLFGRFDRTWADPQLPAQVDWVPGAFTIIRRGALDRVGGFDERFFLYYEEVDLCRRIAGAGYQVWYWPDLEVTHVGGASSKTVTATDFSSSGSQVTLWRMRSALLYYRKHRGALSTWLFARLEIGWNCMRLWRRRDAGARKQFTRNIALMRQAWRDTRGGSHSPERPW